MHKVPFCLVVFLVALFLSVGGSCSPPAKCDEALGVSTITIDPNESSCTKSCECNNQNYSGACIEGKCTAFKRDSCSSQGQERACRIQTGFSRDGCLDGLQVCQPEYLNERRWGDCVPNCKICTPGDQKACYTGPDGSLNKGACRSGLKTCTKSGGWGLCTGMVLPKAESCPNNIDEDCNGKVDDNCKSSVEKSVEAVKERPLEKEPLVVIDEQKSATEPVFEGDAGQDSGPEQKVSEQHPDKGSSPSECVSGSTRPCYSGLFGTVGVGPCKAGTQTCNQSKWGPCVGEVVPRFETCDGTDRDCDGTIAAKSSKSDPCVTTYAGWAFPRYKDGSPAVAQFNAPGGLVFDGAGDLYVADTNNHRIRKIDKDGNATTFAGNGTKGFSDGLARNAQFNAPRGLAFDSAGNLYVADTGNHRIRRIDKKGNVRTFSGSGGRGGKDGPATVAQFYSPKGLAFDAAGILYVADTDNSKIRKIDKSGNVTTLSGNGRGFKNGPIATARFYEPEGLAFDKAGNLYVADAKNSKLRKIDKNGDVTTFAGGSRGFQDGPVATARFNEPASLVFDSAGDLYVFDARNFRIRRVDKSGNVTTFAGSASKGFKDGPALEAQFGVGGELVFDAVGELYVADKDNNRIRKINKNGAVSTFSGSGGEGLEDGPVATAQFLAPKGMAFDVAGNLYVADVDNRNIRKIDKSGNVTTFASSVYFKAPEALAFDSFGNLYLADSGDHRIHKIDKNGKVTVYAGIGVAGYKNGAALSAQFYGPRRLAFDSAGILYVVDGWNFRIRKIDKSRNVTTVAGDGTQGFRDGAALTAQFGSLGDLVFDSAGELYVADSTYHRIRKISKNGVVTTFAGSGVAGSRDGGVLSAQFEAPRGLAIDLAGNIYIAEYLGQRIRKIGVDRKVTSIVLLGVAGRRDGLASNALLNSPRSLAFDGVGALYISDIYNHQIRKIIFVP